MSVSDPSAANELFHVELIEPERLALADRFYRSQGYKVKCASNESVFALVYANGDWVGAVRLVPQVSGHYWLRNLLIAPSYRNRGLATQLLNESRSAIFPRGCYCFALPHLIGFYERAGFESCPGHCPPDIAQRFELYRARGRDWVLMGYRQA